MITKSNGVDGKIRFITLLYIRTVLQTYLIYRNPLFYKRVERTTEKKIRKAGGKYGVYTTCQADITGASK